MSETNSDSTESNDNNMSLYYNHYLRLPHGSPNEEDNEMEIVSSSASFEDSSSGIDGESNSDVQLHNSSDDLSYQSEALSLSPSDVLLNSICENKTPIRVNREKKSWNFLYGLYNREIGGYKNSAMWKYKVNQSVITIQKLKLTKQLKEHDGCVNSLDFNNSGNMLVSGSDDCKICLWKWSEGKCVLKYDSEHSQNIFQTKFINTEGGIQIASCARDGIVALYTLNNADVVSRKIIARHERSCNKLCIRQELPHMILSCGDDGTIKSIDIREPVLQSMRHATILKLKNTNNDKLAIYGIDINPMNLHEFIINGDDEYIKMYDRRHLSKSIKELRRPIPISTDYDPDGFYGSISSDDEGKSHITAALYSYCGTEILASYSEDDIYLFDVNGPTETCLHHYSGHLNRMTIKGVNFFGPRNDYVLSGSDCGNIFIWDKNTEVIVQKKKADVKGVINIIEPHPHITTFASSGLDRTIKIWEPSNMWRQPNRKKLRMCVVKNKVAQERRRRSFSSDENDDNNLD